MALPDSRTTPWSFVLDQPMRILIVDDDPILREFASVYLASPTATIDMACDGVDARALLNEADYDLVLLDIEMPRLDGFSLLDEIRSTEKLRHLPVIMLTGHDDISSIDRAYQKGANSFATKPVNWRQLSYQIRYVVRTNSADRQQAELPAQEQAPKSTPVAVDRNVAEFLQSVIHRAHTLEQRLSLDDRAYFLRHIQAVRASAQRALAECSKATWNSAIEFARGPDASGRGDASTEDRATTDRKSADAIAQQS